MVFKEETIRKWLKRYRKWGLDALFPKQRSDRGKRKAIPDEIYTEAKDLKIELPSRSINTLIDIMKTRGIITNGEISRSTLHRYLKQDGISQRVLKEREAFLRFEAEHVSDMWQSDEKYGPVIYGPSGKAIHTRIFAFLDDKSRLICHCQAYPKGSLLFLEHCLKKAIQKRGRPKTIYVDNAKVYLANQLLRACAYLGIRIAYTEPYSPQSKGKIERFWETLDAFIQEAKLAGFSSLDELNNALFAWIEQRYNRVFHSAIKNTPLNVFLKEASYIQRPDDENIRQAFLFKEDKTIRKDCTFSHAGHTFETLPILANQKVEIRYDPIDSLDVSIYVNGDFFQKAKPFQPPASLPKRTKPGILKGDMSKKTGRAYLDAIVKEYKGAKRKELGLILLSSKPSDDRFTFKDLLDLLGRKGMSLSKEEKKTVQDTFNSFGPFSKTQTEKTLSRMIRQKGKNQHISFYLNAIIKDKKLYAKEEKND